MTDTKRSSKETIVLNNDDSDDDSIIELPVNESAKRDKRQGIAMDTSGSTNDVPSDEANRKCVICISTDLDDPAILSTCTHFFCFPCIQQWMYTNPTCPMCKLPLEKLKHKLRPCPRSFPVDYKKACGEELLIEELLEQFELELIRDAKPAPMRVEENSVMSVILDLKLKLEKIKACTGEGIIQKVDYLRSTEEIQSMLRSYNLLLNRIRTERPRTEIYSSVEFRNTIYRCNLAPRSRVAPKFPINVNPGYIVKHDKEIRTKLFPYFIREFCALTSKTVLDIDPLMDRVMDYLKDASRDARNNFVTFLSKSGIGHPSHFINNLIHFVSSGQKLNVYDENSEFVPRGANDIRFYMGGDNGDVQVLDEIRRADNDVSGFRALEHLMMRSAREDAGTSNSRNYGRAANPRDSRSDEYALPRIRSLDAIRRFDLEGNPYSPPPPPSSNNVVNIDEDDSDGSVSPPPTRRSRWNFSDFPNSFGSAYDFLRSRFPIRGGEDVDNSFMQSFGSRMTPRQPVNRLVRASSPITLDESSSSTPAGTSDSITIDDDSDVEIVNGSSSAARPPKRPRISDL